MAEGKIPVPKKSGSRTSVPESLVAAPYIKPLPIKESAGRQLRNTDIIVEASPKHKYEDTREGKGTIHEDH